MQPKASTSFAGLVASRGHPTARTIPGWRYKKTPHALKKWTPTAEALAQQMYEAVTARIASDSGRLAYRFFDPDGAGEITPDRLVDAYAKADLILSDELAEQVFERYDIDGDGRISMADFMLYWQTAALDLKSYNLAQYNARYSERDAREEIAEDLRNKEQIPPDWNFRELVRKVQSVIASRTPESSKNRRMAYLLFDEFASGSIKPAHLRTKLGLWGMAVNDADIERLYNYFDCDGDGVVSYNDFSRRVVEWDYPLLADNKALKTLGDDTNVLSAYKRPSTQVESLVNIRQVKHVEEPAGRDGDPTKSTEMEAAYGFRHHWNGWTRADASRADHSSFTNRYCNKRQWVSTGGSAQPVLGASTAKGAPIRLDPYSGMPLAPPKCDDDYLDDEQLDATAEMAGTMQRSPSRALKSVGSAARLYAERRGQGVGMFNGLNPRAWQGADDTRGVVPPAKNSFGVSMTTRSRTAGKLPRALDASQTAQHLPTHV